MRPVTPKETTTPTLVLPGLHVRLSRHVSRHDDSGTMGGDSMPDVAFQRGAVYYDHHNDDGDSKQMFVVDSTDLTDPMAKQTFPKIVSAESSTVLRGAQSKLQVEQPRMPDSGPASLAPVEENAPRNQKLQVQQLRYLKAA